MPIDHKGYPSAYHNVQTIKVDPKKAEAPLMMALGRATRERTIDDVQLITTGMTWQEVNLSADGKVLRVPIDDLTAFDKAIESHPEIFKRLIEGKLTPDDVEKLKAVGILNPEEFGRNIGNVPASLTQVYSYQGEVEFPTEWNRRCGLFCLVWV
ncbi:MAG: hypothetical protein AABW52_03785 [Nanoarchaeota archaeon]|mgnify:FL=1